MPFEVTTLTCTMNLIREKKNFRVEGKIDRLQVVGSPQDGSTPKMVVSQNQEKDKVYALLNFNLETNPLDKKCDTRVIVESRPLQIVYDAVSSRGQG